MVELFKLLQKLLGSIPILRQLFSFAWGEGKQAHAAKRREVKDDEVDDLIDAALADPDGLRDSAFRKQSDPGAGES